MKMLWVVWLYAAVIMTWGWWWQRRHQNIGVVDVLWAKGVGASALLLALLGDGAAMPRIALAPDITGVCRVGGTLPISSRPRRLQDCPSRASRPTGTFM